MAPVAFDGLPPGRERLVWMSHQFDAVVSTYDTDVASWTCGRSVSIRTVALEELLGSIAPGGRLLDVGCTTGDAFTRIKQKSLRLDGLDISKRCLSVAAKANPLAKFHLSPVQELPDCLVGEFDAVTCFWTLRYLGTGPELALAFQQMARALKPGGRLLLLDSFRPKSGFVHALYELWYGLAVPATGCLGGAGVSKLYEQRAATIEAAAKPPEVAQLLGDAGFKVTKIKSFSAGAAIAFSATKA